MIPSDMTPPPVTTHANIQNNLKAEYQRGLEDGRRETIEGFFQAMKCQSAKHPLSCRCTDEIEWLRERMGK